MNWDIVNVPTIPWTGETAGKLAGKILDVLKIYWVEAGYFIHFLAKYL